MMRILCCLNRDLASNIALNLLLPALARHQVCIGLTERVGNPQLEADEPPERRELRAAEQRLPNEVLFPLVDASNQPDDGQRFLTFAEIARHRGIRVMPLSTPNSAEGLATVQAFAPDLILTVRYGAILKAPVIAVPRLGVLNLHSGLLPAYRGVLATFRALMAGDTQIGCTLHYITDGTIDTGPIVDSTRVPVVPGQSLLRHVTSLYAPGVAMIATAIERLDRGDSAGAAAQPVGEGAYYSYPTAEEWAAFTKAGWTVAMPSDIDTLMRRYLVGQS